MEKMKKIAVFLSHVYEPMAGLMQKGVKAAALERGVKVIFFASFSDSYSSKNYTEYAKYDEGDALSIDIPNLEDFDGAIKISSSFGEKARQRLEEVLLSANIPSINIGGLDEKLNNICCDETRSFSEVVEHLITRHDCRDIYHLAGLPDKNFTYERIEAYKSTLIRYDIPFDEEKIYFGTLWRDCGEDALNYILDHCKKRGKQYPDAVVCANDYSAIGLVNACRERGIRVPEDIKITGYDGMDDAVNGFPSITTSRQPFFNAGYQAVIYLMRCWEGEKLPKEMRIMGDFMCNQSCGCKHKTADNIEDVRAKYLKRLRNTTNVSQSTTNLMLSVASSKSQEDCFQAIAKNARKDTGFKEMLLCMAPDWDKQRIVGEKFSETDEEMSVVAGFRGEEAVPFFTFRKKDILPKDMLEDPNPYYVFTIHHLQYYMGYMIVSPDIDACEQEAMQSWLVDLGVILENRRIHRDLRLSVARLEFMYNRDMLTGIYNRRGAESFFGEYFTECLEKGTGLALMMLDMDDLKKINDNYGHNEGDYSLKTIADAMTYAASEDEICTRSGGDEFLILAKNYTQEKIDNYIKRLREFIADKVRKDNKPFIVNVSVGTHLGIPVEADLSNSHEVFENYLRIADAAMYVEKRRHKENRV